MKRIAELIDRGGVYFNIPGNGAAEAITEMFKGLRLPPTMDKDAILGAVLERESLMPTALGMGIAIPHPRSPMAPAESDERIVVAYAKKPIDFRALDERPVYALFLILSSSQKSHLSILSKLSFLLHAEAFRKFLESKPGKAELCAAIGTFTPGA
jgi:nitrogen PTS system EIIA component